MNRTPEPLSITHMEVINDRLLIAWSDESDSLIPLRALRDNCPCAHCSGETDALGNVYIGPPRKLTASSYTLVRIEPVGHYAVKPVWQDRHDAGLYTMELLKKIENFGSAE